MESWALAEMLGAEIKDKRRRKSMAAILSNLEQQPSLSFSAAAGPAKRQAAHRLFKHEQVEVEHLLAGHYTQTQKRIQAECEGGLLLVVQDTTEFDFTGLKATGGLGYINHTNARGLFGHSALALTPEGLPLGLMHLQLWAREDADYGKGKDRRERDLSEKESYRWIQTLQSVEKQLPVGQQVLFIQDREADIFGFLQAPRRPNTFLLVRANQPRRVEVLGEGQACPWQKSLLFNVASAAPVVASMQVSLPRAPARPKRNAELIVQTTPVRILAPQGRKGVSSEPVSAWIVRAYEAHPPDGQAIEWVLISTLPVPDAQTACQLVAYYAKRWVIERLHYTIKSGGCKAEQLQMDTLHSLEMALALYYVTAWRLLFMTYLSRVEPEAPAACILRPSEIEVLEKIENKPIPTISLAMIAIAKLGGYAPYKNAPPPGVKVLWIGLRRLEDMEVGWLLATQNQPWSTTKDMIQD